MRVALHDFIGNVEVARAVHEAAAGGFLRMLLAMSPWQPTSP
jgi:hypothetical protein